ncbi:hypothetical protein B4086_5704 [Bacillus cereus]|nr:hypothetical protein B4086_5704 [Bacillus cereus]
MEIGASLLGKATYFVYKGSFQTPELCGRPKVVPSGTVWVSNRTSKHRKRVSYGGRHI